MRLKKRGLLGFFFLKRSFASILNAEEIERETRCEKPVGSAGGCTVIIASRILCAQVRKKTRGEELREAERKEKEAAGRERR